MLSASLLSGKKASKDFFNGRSLRDQEFFSPQPNRRCLYANRKREGEGEIIYLPPRSRTIPPRRNGRVPFDFLPLLAGRPC